MVAYIVEHLDEELYPWSKCEYLSLTQYVAPSQVVLSNAAFETPREWPCMANLAISKESVAKLGVPFESICLLDSESPTMLTPEDASRFSHFLFGGILGNTDEFDFDRTKVLRELGFPSRNLGPVQMTTDTAVKTTQHIIEQGRCFEELEFLAGPQGAPLMAPGIRELLLADKDVFDLGLLE